MGVWWVCVCVETIVFCIVCGREDKCVGVWGGQ